MMACSAGKNCRKPTDQQDAPEDGQENIRTALPPLHRDSRHFTRIGSRPVGWVCQPAHSHKSFLFQYVL